MPRILLVLAGCVLAAAAQAATLADLSSADASSGLKQALTQGAGKAVDRLGRPDGFTGNPKVRIGLPGKVRKAEGMLRGLGMGAQTDELVLAMNRAAEAAVPAAKPLLVDAIQHMSVIDAKTSSPATTTPPPAIPGRTTSQPLAENQRASTCQAVIAFP